MTSIDKIGNKPAKTQVMPVVSPQVLPLLLPHHPGSTSPHPHSYHSLSHCLRTNIFPGAPLAWKSLSRDSYTRHSGTAMSADPHLWFGHKTDDLVQWTERNIMNQKLKKLLTEMEKKKVLQSEVLLPTLRS